MGNKPKVYKSADGRATHPLLLPKGPYWECPECGSKELARWQAPQAHDDETVICACFACRGQWKSEWPPLSDKMREIFLMVADELGGVVLGESRDWIGIIVVPLRPLYPNLAASTGGYLLIYTDCVSEEKRLFNWQQADEELGAGEFRDSWNTFAHKAFRGGAQEVRLSPLAPLLKLAEDEKWV